ncbi:Proton pump-interactor 1 [Sesamum angolense]|uniref:Proton pump-interactor 1 n=1 Tax=Sesamum angolense TaxID=2727404 RepID=A0AAE1WAY6_9LAMI|nr:Proton pump-interactor 1 [Sesamum angolense]
MADTEVSKEVSEVVGNQEKCGSDMGSYQDLPTSDCNGTNHHNQANDLDNSYVFVTGTDGLPDDSVGNNYVVAEGDISPKSKSAATVKDQESELDSQIEKLDAVSGQVSEPLDEGETGNVERSNDDSPILSDSTWKHKGSLEDGEGLQVLVADSVEENTGKTESSAEAEIKHVEDSDGNIESWAEAVEEKIGDQHGKTEGEAEGEQEKLHDLINSETPPGPTENQESQDGALCLSVESGENGELNNKLLHTNSSGNANDECAGKINLSATATSEACQQSEDEVVDAIDCKLQDVSVEEDAAVKICKEVGETAGHEVPPSTSSDLESYPAKDEGEPLKEEAKTTLSLDILEDKNCDTTLDNKSQEEQKNVDSFASHVGNGAQCPEERDQHPDASAVSSETMQSETKSEAAAPTQSLPASNDHAPQTEFGIFNAEGISAESSAPVQKSETTENGLLDHDSQIMCTTSKASSESDPILDTVIHMEKESTLEGREGHAETTYSSLEGTLEGREAHVQTEDSSCKAKVENDPLSTTDVKLETEAHIEDFSTMRSGEKTVGVTVAGGMEFLDSLNVNNEGAANTVLEIEDVEDMGDELAGAARSSNENSSLLENEDSGTSAESFIVNGVQRKEASVKAKTKPFNFLIRIPRFDDDSLREQIRLAKLHVDEKTKLRDAIQVQIQEKRANSQIHGIDYEYAKVEGRSARKLVRSKRMEIESLQSVINKAKNALSVDDIDSQIYNMEHMIQHETLPLKEEKQLIREIKQLKQLREQLSSNMGTQDEIKQALEQREEIEDRLKILRKELDILKNKVLKAEAAAAEAEKKYDGENKKVKELQAQFRAADDVRQAYVQLQSLRKELSKTHKHFFKYKDDAAVANNYAFSRDTEALYRLCMNHVENFMELWNTNVEFRREYARFNRRSTVRRFGTLDGRSLGPDEKPPNLPSHGDERVNRRVSVPVKVDVASQSPTLELKQETTGKEMTSDGQSMKKVTERKNHKVMNKGPATPVLENGFDTVSGGDLADEVYEEPKKSKDEIESMRKAEELKREEVEAKLKEQRRLEALAKANEARERKRRQAEKLQMRAELKTQKEAEQREKEREKRLRKKERKKAAASDVSDTNNNCETAPSSESASELSKETEVKDTSSVTPKKAKKPWLFGKQSKPKSVPPAALRNRNKKKLQQWMWVGMTSLIILVLFWLGNIGVFSNVNLKRRSPIY